MFALLDGAHLSQCPADCLTWLVDASVKATVVLALAYVASIVLRRADASIRRALWTAALLGVLFMPVLSYVTPSWRLALLPALRVTPDNIATFAAAPAETVGSPVSGKHQEVFPDRSQPPGVIAGPLRKTRKSAVGVLLESLVRTPWGTAAALPVLGVWLIGVMVVLGRLAAGLKRTIRYTRTATPLIDEAWRSQIVQLTAQMRCTRKITLLGHDEIATPITWGVLRPVILLPGEAESWSARRRRLVLLHELSHIRKNDWSIQILAQLACAAYWFNPLVWTAAKCLYVERERACDSDVIAAGAKPSEYATHLIDIAKSMSSRRTVPVTALAMTRCSQLKGRVTWMLNDRNHRRWGTVLLVPMLLGMTGLILSLGAAQLWSDPPVHRGDPTTPQMHAEAVGVWTADQEDEGLHLHLGMPAAGWSSSMTILAHELTGLTTGPDVRFTLHRDAGTFFFEGHFNRSKRRSHGSGSFTFHADPDYIHEMRMLGFTIAEPEGLLTFALQDVSLDYTRGICSLGYDRISADQLVRFCIHGVSPEFVRQLADLGYRHLAPDELIAFRTHGVTDGYIRDLTHLGYRNVSPEQLVAFRVHGVGPEFIDDLAGLGYSDVAPEQLVAFRTHQVGSEFVREAAAHGYTDLSARELIEFRIHGFGR